MLVWSATGMWHWLPLLNLEPNWKVQLLPNSNYSCTCCITFSGLTYTGSQLHGESLQYWTVDVIGNRDVTLTAIIQPRTELENAVTSKLKLHLHLLHNLSGLTYTGSHLHGESLHYWTVGLIGNRDLTPMAMTQPRTGLLNSVTSKIKLNLHLLNNLCWCNREMFSPPRWISTILDCWFDWEHGSNTDGHDST
jgi:hypothetical protein